MSPSSFQCFNHGTYRSIRPAMDAVAETENPSQESPFTGNGGFIRGDSSGPRRAVASHSGTPSGTLAFSHCEFLTSAG